MNMRKGGGQYQGVSVVFFFLFGENRIFKPAY